MESEIEPYLTGTKQYFYWYYFRFKLEKQDLKKIVDLIGFNHLRKFTHYNINQKLKKKKKKKILMKVSV